MARDPGSVWSPLPEAGAPDGHVKTQFIVHSTGDNGTAAATRRYFAGATPNESTFIVGWGPSDPTLQIMDSTDRADANGSANTRGISVEVVGDGIGGYNAWQRAELIRLARWSMAAHPGILPQIIPSEPAPGLGWHVMFGAPGPWASVAKSCPGKRRIHELKTDIFPAIFAGGQEDDMTPEQDRMLRDLHRAVGADKAAAIPLPISRSVLAVGWDVQAALTSALPVLLAEAQQPDSDPAALTAAVVAAIPATIAQDVIDGLAARLADPA